MEQSLFLALPRRPGLVVEGEGPGHVRAVKPTGRGRFKIAVGRGSAFCLKCNRLWLLALDCREAEGLTHFAMQHDDVEAPPGWADVLIDELDRTGADVCSAVVPIKDRRGVTSTAIRDVTTGQVRRVTMAELFGKLPETFAVEDLQAAGLGFGEPGREVLLVNNGLWVCRFDRDWVERWIGWRIIEGIVRNTAGQPFVSFFSEDWFFSEWCAERGLKVVATRKVPVIHRDADGTEYRSDRVWGEWETDRGDDPRA